LSYANAPDYDDDLALNRRAALQWRRGGERSKDATEALALLLDLTTGTDGIVNWEGSYDARTRAGGTWWSDDDNNDDNGNR
jgi:hypothetical protein